MIKCEFICVKSVGVSRSRCAFANMRIELKRCILEPCLWYSGALTEESVWNKSQGALQLLLAN